jgi:thiamine-phosphate pyrophosphorylase
VAAIERPAARLRGLYAVTPDEHDSARLVAMVDAALQGGARAVQYRNKQAPPALREAQAAALARLCARHGALFIVNDDAQVARTVGADGVHIGEDDGALSAAREAVGDAALVGVSCYDDLARGKRAVEQGADYIAFGSFFASRVKPGARHADVSLIPAAKRLGVPVVAIGGITVASAPALLDAGVDAIAVISAVFAHDDVSAITQAAADLAALFAKGEF